MKELGEALKLVFSKVAGFFDIFDLSFFISGIASATAIATFLHHVGVPVISLLDSKVGVFLAAIASYSLGLVSFASGRFLRKLDFMGKLVRLVRKKDKRMDLEKRTEKEYETSEQRFIEALTAHGLTDKGGFREYLTQENEKLNSNESSKTESKDEESIRIQALYIRMWAEIRHSDRLSASLELLNSYWVKAATFDGLAVSLLIWVGVFLSSASGWVILSHLSRPVSSSFAAIFFLAALSCFHEAKRYREYQAKELVATIASGINLK